MPVFYDRNWDRRSQWTKVNYIRPGHTMGFWKLHHSIWDSKNYCGGFRWNFFWDFQEDFPKDLTNPSIFSFKRQPQGNYK